MYIQLPTRTIKFDNGAYPIYKHAYIFFKSNQVVEIQESDDAFLSTKHVDYARKIIADKQYDYAYMVFHDPKDGKYWPMGSIHPINVLEQKYWVRFLCGKPSKARLVNIININKENGTKTIEFKNSTNYWGKVTQYLQYKLNANILFDSKKDADKFYKKEIEKYKKMKIKEAIKKYKRMGRS